MGEKITYRGKYFKNYILLNIYRFFYSIFFIFLSAFFLFGCGEQPPNIIATQQKINQTQKKIVALLQNKTTVKIPKDYLEPLILLPSWEGAQIKALNKKISIVAINTPLKDILNLISQATDLDIVYKNNLNTNVKIEDKIISIKVKNKKIKDVLDLISNIANIHYEIKKGTLIISDTVTKIYDVGIPKVASQSTIFINGNIFGTNENKISALNSLENSYTNVQTNDPYLNLQNAIKKAISKYGKFYLDEDTGTLLVTDRPKNIKEIDKIVQRFKYFYSKEVDVKITILDFSEENAVNKGVNWQIALTKMLDNFNIAYSPLETTAATGLIIKASSVGTGPKLENFIFNFLTKIGKVKILSTPRIRLTNGYSAIIISGEIKPFWTKSSTNIVNGTTLSNYSFQNYINGYVLILKARVNEQNQIYLVITPVKNVIKGKSVSPDGSSEAPIVSTNVISTILKINSGDIVILGGLKNDSINTNIEGLPQTNSKLFNYLTSTLSKQSEKKQLLIIIQAKLVR